MVVPDSIRVYMEISGQKRFCEMWKVVGAPRHKLYLRTLLNQMYCTDGGNIITHLEDMERICQQLASLNAKISDEDYIDTIVRSLSQSYPNLTCLLRIYGGIARPTAPAAIKDAIRREYEARQTRRAASVRNNRSNGIALHTDTRGRAPGRGRGRGRGGNRGGNRRRGPANENRVQSGLICFNCGGEGHKAAVCPSQKPKEDRQDERKGDGETRDRAAPAITDDDEEEARMVMAMGASEIAESAVHGMSYNPVRT